MTTVSIRGDDLPLAVLVEPDVFVRDHLALVQAQEAKSTPDVAVDAFVAMKVLSDRLGDHALPVVYLKALGLNGLRRITSAVDVLLPVVRAQFESDSCTDAASVVEDWLHELQAECSLLDPASLRVFDGSRRERRAQARADRRNAKKRGSIVIEGGQS